MSRGGGGPSRSHTSGRAAMRITRGAGTWTSFGSVALLSARRQTGGGSRATHQASAAPGSSEHAWPDVLRVVLEVHNGLGRYLLFSPGQFRLQVGPAGTTVAPLVSDGRPRAIAPGATVTTWVSYLAPAGERATMLEFADAGLGAPLLRLELPAHTPDPRPLAAAGGAR